MLDFVFDSNCIRDLARKVKTEEEWEAISSAWQHSEYRTAWIPWTIGEVMGTNLMSQTIPLTTAFCKETALAVRRFDFLAEGKILPDVKASIKWAIRAFVEAGIPLPEGDSTNRGSIEAAKRLESPDQVRVTQVGNEWVIEIRDDHLGQWGVQRVPYTFAEDTAERVQKWKERLQKAGRLREDTRDDEIYEAIGEHVLPAVVGMGKSLGVPDEVLLQYSAMPIGDYILSPFMFGSVAQDWYCIQRALGRKTGRIQETLGRDLVIAFYIPMAWRFVASDIDFAKLIGKVLPSGMFLPFDEFKKGLLEGREFVRPS